LVKRALYNLYRYASDSEGAIVPPAARAWSDVPVVTIRVIPSLFADYI
jgi:hypothetical protein